MSIKTRIHKYYLSKLAESLGTYIESIIFAPQFLSSGD